MAPSAESYPGNATTFPLPVVNLVALYADVEEVSALTQAAPSYHRSIASHVWSSVLHRQYGREDGAWLSRCPPQRRQEVLGWLVSTTAPRISPCRVALDTSTREGHTLVTLPRVCWPQSAREADVSGVMLLYGGVGGNNGCRPLDAVMETSIVTLHGNVDSNDQLEATFEHIGSSPSPPARFSHGAAWLDDLGSMIVYGGRRGRVEMADSALGDVWLLEHVKSSWRWVEVSSATQLPPARCHFASCALSGRSLFVHGGHTGRTREGVLGDAWICWIDDGHALGDIDEGSARGRQSSSLSRQVSEQLTRQVSNSYQKLAPQVSVARSDTDFVRLSGPEMADSRDDLQTVAYWRCIEADGELPPACCGHSATCSPDGIIIHGLWSGSVSSHCLGPIHVLEGLSDPTLSVGRKRAHYTRLQSSYLSSSREWAILQTVFGRPVLVGGLGSNKDSINRAWHATCKLPLSEVSGPAIVVFGG